MSGIKDTVETVKEATGAGDVAFRRASGGCCGPQHRKPGS